MTQFEHCAPVLIALLLICFFILGRSWRTRKPHVFAQRRLPITRRRIVRIAAGSYIAAFLTLFLFSAALIVLSCVYGRMRPKAALLSALLIMSVLFLCCYPQIRSQCKPLRSLRKMPDFNRQFAGKQLVREADAWEYIADDWFIRLSPKCSVLLCTRQIDFSFPARITRNSWYAPSKTGSGSKTSLYCLRFRRMDGKNIDANTSVDSKLRKWVKQHGGTIAK